eukprot:scaffold32607_cov51-Phaeocystis_antarctica.AAC.3
MTIPCSPTSVASPACSCSRSSRSAQHDTTAAYLAASKGEPKVMLLRTDSLSTHACSVWRAVSIASSE